MYLCGNEVSEVSKVSEIRGWYALEPVRFGGKRSKRSKRNKRGVCLCTYEMTR